MKPPRRQNLAQKGWTEAEIKKAEGIIETAERHDLYLSKIAFWSAMVVIIFANIIVSLILIPFLVVLNQWVLYSIVIILAGTIGFLYNFLITDIRHLERKHHLAAAIIIPIIALANIILVVLVSNRFIADAKIQNTPHNPWLTALVFSLAFILPYLIDQTRIHFSPQKALIIR